MPSTAHRLIDAFLSGDAPSAAALLAPDAKFHSPIRDYAGAEQISAVWRAVAGVVANARPTSVHERDRERIAFFAGTIKAQPVDGVLRTLTSAREPRHRHHAHDPPVGRAQGGARGHQALSVRAGEPPGA